MQACYDTMSPEMYIYALKYVQSADVKHTNCSSHGLKLLFPHAKC